MGIGRLIVVLGLLQFCLAQAWPASSCEFNANVFFPEHITVGMWAADGNERIFPPEEVCGPFDAGYRFIAGVGLAELLVSTDVLWLAIRQNSPPLPAEEVALWAEYLRRGGGVLVTVSSGGLDEANGLLEAFGTRLRLKRGDGTWESTTMVRVPTPRWPEDLAPLLLTETSTLTGIDAPGAVLLEHISDDEGRIPLGELEAVGRGHLVVVAGLLPLEDEADGFDNCSFVSALLGWLGAKGRAGLAPERDV